MFLRFLFLAMLVVAAGPHDAIAEEPGDVFGFKWKMSYAEANKIASRPMEKEEKRSHYGKTEYRIGNPKKPSDATSIYLSFFNDELYSMNAYFFIKSDNEFVRKTKGLVSFLKAKHPEAKIETREKGIDFYFFFRYRTEADFIENPYNLEKITIWAKTGGVTGGGYALVISYNFYGTQEIEAHIKKMKDEKEFGGF